MGYKDAGPNLAAKTALWALPLFQNELPVEQVAPLALETCSNLRTLAIMALLDQGNERQFLANLSQSARAWVLFLRRAKAAQLRPHHYVSGRIDPILDGIAAGDKESIAWIAELAPAEKQGRSEYEDDYCYARLLLGLSADGGKDEALMPLVARYRQFEDGPRVTACEALIQRSSEGFHDALLEVIARFQKYCAELAERSEASPELTARCSICIEGLALLRLADKRGVPTDLEYPLCPSQARLPYVGAFPQEFTVR
jgi:hypothetical protein